MSSVSFIIAIISVALVIVPVIAVSMGTTDKPMLATASTTSVILFDPENLFFAGGFNSLFQFSDVIQWWQRSSFNTNPTFKLSVPRAYLTATSAVKNLYTVVYFAGGLTQTGVTNIIDVINMNNYQMTTLTLSVARYGLASSTLYYTNSRTSIAIFAGGVLANGQPTNLVDYYNPDDNTWQTTTISTARYAMASTTIYSQVFFAGGINADNSPSDVIDIFYYSNGLNRITKKLSTPRKRLSATSLFNSVGKGQAYFSGGIDNTNTVSNVLDVYYTFDGVVYAKTMPTRRYNFTSSSTISFTNDANFAYGKIFFIGGFTSMTTSSATNTVDIFDEFNNVWTTSSITTPVTSLSSGTVYNNNPVSQQDVVNRAVAFGGLNSNGVVSSNIDYFSTTCALGYYRFDSFQEFSPCQICPIGTYCPNLDLYSYSCPLGHYCPSTGMSQIGPACSSGSFCDYKSSQQKPCPSGSYCPTPAQKITCASGTYCPQSSTNYTICPLGSRCYTPSYIEPCYSGMYCPEGSTVGICATPGNYCPDPTKPPLPCIEGYSCSTSCIGINSGNNINNYKCNSAYYCPSGSVTPLQCPPGYYCPDGKKKVICPIGSYCPGFDSGISFDYLSCPQGKYCPELGMSEGLPCPKGNACDIGTINPINCPINTFSNLIVCNRCPDNYYTESVNSTECIPNCGINFNHWHCNSIKDKIILIGVTVGIVLSFFGLLFSCWKTYQKVKSLRKLGIPVTLKNIFTSINKSQIMKQNFELQLSKSPNFITQNHQTLYTQNNNNDISINISNPKNTPVEQTTPPRNMARRNSIQNIIQANSAPRQNEYGNNSVPRQNDYGNNYGPRQNDYGHRQNDYGNNYGPRNLSSQSRTEITNLSVNRTGSGRPNASSFRR